MAAGLHSRLGPLYHGPASIPRTRPLPFSIRSGNRGSHAPLPAGDSGGLSDSQLAAAIAVPVVVTVVLLAALGLAVVLVMKKRKAGGWGAVAPPGAGSGTTLLLTDIQNSTGALKAMCNRSGAGGHSAGAVVQKDGRGVGLPHLPTCCLERRRAWLKPPLPLHTAPPCACSAVGDAAARRDGRRHPLPPRRVAGAAPAPWRLRKRNR